MFEIANFALGISYDINISGLKTATAAKGGIEISFFPLMGIFAEYNNGTSTYQGDVSIPNGEKRYRVDNHLYIFGVTFRI